jgi:hypothetical protein
MGCFAALAIDGKDQGRISEAQSAIFRDNTRTFRVSRRSKDIRRTTELESKGGGPHYADPPQLLATEK